MCFGYCCFFYIVAASATLPIFTFGRSRSQYLLRPSCALPLLVQALLVPLFFIGCSLSIRFLCALTFYFFTLNSPRTFRCPTSPDALDLTLLAPYRCPAFLYLYALSCQGTKA